MIALQLLELVKLVAFMPAHLVAFSLLQHDLVQQFCYQIVEAPMLVQLRDFPDTLADQLKRATGQNTASKAVHTAASRYAGLVAQVKRLQAEVQRLEERADVADQVIARARDSAAALLDHVAQGDLLNGK